MRRARSLLLGLVLLALLVAGCGGAAGARETKVSPQYARKIERLAHSTCASLGLRPLARRLRVAAVPEQVASAYGRTWPAYVRAQATSGCLRAFEGR